MAAVWAPSPPEPANLKLMSSGIDVGRKALREARRPLCGGVQGLQKLFWFEGARRDGRERLAVGRVLLHPEREDRDHVVPHPVLGSLGIETEMQRALGQDLDEGEAAYR